MSRVGLATLLLAFLGVPVLLPILSAVRSPDFGTAFAEAGRLWSLAANTAALAALAGLIAVPLGTALAFVLQRVPVHGGAVLRGAVLAGLFVPLPVTAVAWQVVLGTWLPPLQLEPGAVAWRAWNIGLLPAAFVHGMAAVPWVAWIAGELLALTDRGLEDDAAQAGGAWAVARRVIVPRLTVAMTAAAGWVAVQAATEIPVTDAMMVRTFAEEVYTAFAGAGGMTAAVAVTLPGWAVGVVAGLLALRRATPPGETELPAPLRVPRWATRVGTVFAWAVVGLFAGLPLMALIRQACGSGGLPGLVAELAKVVRSDGAALLVSLLWAAITGAIVAFVARRACWLAVRSAWFARLLFVLCVGLALTPGPVVGFGLKATIGHLLDVEDAVFGGSVRPLTAALYNGPSPVPVMWAAAVRLFPVACVLLWPAVRAIPRELIEAVAIDGHGAGGVWRLVIAPLTRGAAGRAAVAVAALSLCEVSAGKLVATPGGDTYILRLFAQMHYGPEATVAALCLLQVGVSVGLAAAAGFTSGR